MKKVLGILVLVFAFLIVSAVVFADSSAVSVNLTPSTSSSTSNHATLKLRTDTWSQYAPYFPKPPVINGEINLSDEWYLSPRYYLGLPVDVGYQPEKWEGQEKQSAVYYLGWDNNYFYMAMEVNATPVVQMAVGTNMWQGDHIELWFDTQLQEDFDLKQPNKAIFQIGISPGNFDFIKPEVYVWTPPVLASEIAKCKLAAVETSTGYNFEIAIPWKLLNVEPKPGMVMGFVVSPSFTNEPGTLSQDVMISSSPKSPNNWGDPQFFGNLFLVDPVGAF